MPFLHFFDGFRTSHEVNKIELLSDDDLRALVDEDASRRTAARRSTPDHPSPRHGPEPRRLLPGARGVEPVLRRRAAASSRTRWTASARAPAALPACSSTPGTRGRARPRRDGLGGVGDRARDGASSWSPRARKSALSGPALPPVPAAMFAAALPAHVARIAVLDRTKEPGRASASRSTWTSWQRSHERGTRCRGDRSSAAATAWLEGIHAADGCAVFDELDSVRPRYRARPSATSLSASSTT